MNVIFEKQYKSGNGQLCLCDDGKCYVKYKDRLEEFCSYSIIQDDSVGVFEMILDFVCLERDDVDEFEEFIESRGGLDELFK